MARDGIEPPTGASQLLLYQLSYRAKLWEHLNSTTFGLQARRATELLHPPGKLIMRMWDSNSRTLTRLTVFKTVPFSRTVILQQIVRVWS